MAEEQGGNGLLARVARIDERTQLTIEKIDLLHREEKERHQTVCNKIDDHEDRIRKLESQNWWRNGIAALSGALSGLGASFLKGP